MTKTALLLGGTGAMGVYLTPELVARGFEVNITTRSSSRPPEGALKYIEGDAHNIDFLKQLLESKKYDVIVDFMVYSTDEFRHRYELLLNNCRQYIFLSSYRVFSDAKIITEETPRLLDASSDVEFLKTEDYSLVKARQEDILNGASMKNWTIVRPAITYSKERFQLGTLEADIVVWRALRDLPVILPKDMLNKRTTMTWAGDVARLMSALVLNKSTLGEDYNIATGESRTWEEVANIYKDTIDLKVLPVETDEYIEALGGEFNNYQVYYDRMFNRVIDNTKILEVTGTKQNDFVSLKDGLSRELRNFIKSPKFDYMNYVRHAYIDKLTKSRMDVSELSSEERVIYREINPRIADKIRRGLQARARSLLSAVKHKIRIRTRLSCAVKTLGEYVSWRQFRHFDGAILTLTGYFNYGNVIQRYALQRFLQKNDLNFVSYVDPYSAPRDIYRFSRIARLKTPLRALKRALRHQKPYWHTPKYGDMYPEARRTENIINFVNKNILIKQFDPRDNYKNYIVGSDQVWRDWWGNRETLGYYFFNFLKGKEVKRISYAASFGKDKVSDVMSDDTVEYIRPYIEQFDGVSVREKSGVKMVEKTWGLEGVREVVDPTLLLDAADYSRLIDQSSVEHEKIQQIFTYIIDETDNTRSFVQKVSDRRRQSFAGMRAHGGAEDDTLPPVELWLKGFRDAELVVTNSFHGMMFSVINNTDFIVIGREDGGLSRIKDFLSEYGISGRFVDEAKLVDFDLAKLKKINWAEVNKKLDRRRKESGDWLLAQLHD